MKVLLVDGNFCMYRYYFATAYNNANILKTSFDQPINAVYKFIKSINRFINENSYDSYVVCFDKSKQNYRHKILPTYKGNRNKTPDELRSQFPIAKEFLKAINLDYLELDNFEADDIIGCLARQAEAKNYKVDILTSDKDLYQMVTDNVNIISPVSGSKNQGTFKTIDKDYIFKKWNLTPDRIPDLKGLMGDSSDNYKGVKGIGEKGAVKLLSEFKTLENIINSIDKLTGSIKNKVAEDKDEALKCKEIATIQTDCLDYDYHFVTQEKNLDAAQTFYAKYEMNSLLNKNSELVSDIKYEKINIFSLDFVDQNNENTIYIETLEENYFTSPVLGMAIVNAKGNFLLSLDKLKNDKNFQEFLIGDYPKNTYDLKKTIVILNKFNLGLKNVANDLLISSYVLNHYIDLKLNYLNVYHGTDINLPNDKFFYTKALKENLEKNNNEINKHIMKKAMIIHQLIPKVITKLKTENLFELYKNIDLPVSSNVAQMEINGLKIDQKLLEEQIIDITNKLEKINKKIITLVGEEINIQSPKQVQELLYQKLELTDYLKGSTAVEALNKIKSEHEVVQLILDNRTLNKLLNSYLLSFKKHLHSDSKVHSIFKLTKVNTGRLSSVEPNIQGVSIKNPLQKKMRLFFIPSSKENYFLSLDYSQIELRILAHLSNDQSLIESFNNDEDIHSIVAAKIFNISKEDVTSDHRRKAKVVNFGIIYGMTSYGLAEELNVSIDEAKLILETYFLKSPAVKTYLNSSVELAKKNGYVETLFKRKKYIPEIKSTNNQIFTKGARMAKNMPIQGTAADILKMAINKVAEKIKTLNYKPLLVAQIHDELIYEIPKKHIDEASEMIAAEMEKVIKFKVKMKVNYSYGDTWFDLK